jgi:hypothetical protein
MIKSAPRIKRINLRFNRISEEGAYKIALTVYEKNLAVQQSIGVKMEKITLVNLTHNYIADPFQLYLRAWDYLA